MSEKVRCTVLNCTSFTDNKTVIYFRYPLENPELLKKWLVHLNRPNWRPIKGDAICSRHFKMSDINNPLNKNLASLKPNAVPVIFPSENKSPKSNSNLSPNSNTKNSNFTPKTVRSNMIVRKQVDPKSPGSIVFVPIRKSPNLRQMPVIPKSPSIIVSKAKTTGMTLVKKKEVRGIPGRKRKNVEKSEDNLDKKKKRPILRICVNKLKRSGGEAERSEGVVDEIEAESVIFRLDPVSREIIVLKKDEEEEQSEAEEGKGEEKKAR